MIIIYGNRKKLKIDRIIGNTVCPNCHHAIEETLAHEISYLHVFYIPIIPLPAPKMRLCPNCGIIEKLSKAEFKDLKNQLPPINK